MSLNPQIFRSLGAQGGCNMFCEGSQVTPEKLKNIRNFESHEININIIYLKLELLLYPPGILLLIFSSYVVRSTLLQLPPGGHIWKIRVPTGKHAVGPCNLNLNV